LSALFIAARSSFLERADIYGIISIDLTPGNWNFYIFFIHSPHLEHILLWCAGTHAAKSWLSTKFLLLSFALSLVGRFSVF
jgi:hypothetical protein